MKNKIIMKKYIQIIESPFAPKDKTLKKESVEYQKEVNENIEYAQFAANYLIKQGYPSFASHLYYTQPNILDDTIPEEHEIGIQAGFNLLDSLWEVVDEENEIKKLKCNPVFFIDYGISGGMMAALKRAQGFLPNGEHMPNGEYYLENIKIDTLKGKGYRLKEERLVDLKESLGNIISNINHIYHVSNKEFCENLINNQNLNPFLPKEFVENYQIIKDYWDFEEKHKNFNDILLKSFVKNDENIFLENVYEKYPNLQKLKNSTLKHEEAIDVMLDKIYFKDPLGEKLQKTLLLVNGFTDKHVDRIMGYFSHVNQTLLYGSKKNNETMIDFVLNNHPDKQKFINHVENKTKEGNEFFIQIKEKYLPNQKNIEAKIDNKLLENENGRNFTTAFRRNI